MCWDFTNSKSCKIPAIWKARVCDGIEFSLALSQYSRWRIILHGSRNRHFYVLLIFYLKLNCRYRVINKIHPCLSHTNSFLSKVFSWLCGEPWGGSAVGGMQGEVRWARSGGSAPCQDTTAHGVSETTVPLGWAGAGAPSFVSVTCQPYAAYAWCWRSDSLPLPYENHTLAPGLLCPLHHHPLPLLYPYKCDLRESQTGLFLTYQLTLGGDSCCSRISGFLYCVLKVYTTLLPPPTLPIPATGEP